MHQKMLTAAGAPSHLLILYVVSAGKNGEELGTDEKQVVSLVHTLYDITNNKVVSLQSHYVKPQQDDLSETILTDECKEETGLDENKVKNGLPLEVVLEEVDRFLLAKGVHPDRGGNSFVLLTDGQCHLRQCIHNEISVKNSNCMPPKESFTLPSYYYKFYDIRKEFKKRYEADTVEGVKSMLDCAALQDRLQVFEACLGPRGKLRNAAKEKAFANYYKTYCENHKSLTELTRSAHATAMISLKLFEKLIEIAYGCQRQLERTPFEVSDKERDVIGYVAGSVVKKLKKRVWALKKNHYREEKLKCLDALCYSKSFESGVASSSTDMTTVLDRGGLTFVKDNILQMFLDMEEIFREAVGGAGSVNVQASDKEFFNLCLSSESVPVCFFDTMYNFDISLKVQEDVFENAVMLFFKIRVHHKLRVMMDTVQRGWKEKSMRKRLRPSETGKV